MVLRSQLPLQAPKFPRLFNDPPAADLCPHCLGIAKDGVCQQDCGAKVRPCPQ